MIIDRYLSREIYKPMLVVCAILVIIFASYSATRLLADATYGLLSAGTVCYLIALKVVIALEVLLPMTLYLSIVVGLGRLYSDSEITAMLTCGIRERRIFKVVLLAAMMVSILVAGLSLYIRPLAYQTSYRLKEWAAARFDISRMDPATFYEIEQGRRVIFAEEIDQQARRARQVFIQTQEEQSIQVITAREAYQQSTGKNGTDTLVFLNGDLHEISLTSGGDTSIEFKEYLLSLSPPTATQLYKTKAADTMELIRNPTPDATAELQWRFSAPLTAILLALLGIPLSQTKPRRSKYAKVVTAVLIYAVYYTVSLTTKTWIRQGVIGSIPGLWGVLMLLAALLLLLSAKPALLLRRKMY
ncbi:MAG: LPS export ABC transporter permease LptF [Deltaproteobacteria bacterium]|nr:LPS export ABC transporter permease LptF [Candidatus Anaeroferrophillus wilburensis]MBN2887718.1 LPS export ABC transporter permease LptF [Deltaproteobacteria bacterium]